MAKPGPRKKDFWEWVDKLEPDMCWPWLGATEDGLPKWGNVFAHRHAYELVHGKVGRRHVIHTCGQRSCCNASHITLKVATCESDSDEPSPDDATIASFWSRVEVTEGHWMWQGVITQQGQPLFRHHSATVFSYRLFVGPVRPGYRIRRCCGVRGCISPWHLQRHRVHGQRACPRGHKLTKANTRITKDGYKVCRECDRQGHARKRAQTHSVG